MKVRPFSFAIVAFAFVLFISAPAFSAETAAPEAAPATAQEKPVESTTPAAPAPATEPAAAPAAEPATAPAAEPAAAPTAKTTLQIKETVVCQDVVDRAPVGSGDVFAKETAKIYCFTHVVGASEETQITHNWYYKGTLKSSVKLPVRSNNWRTWSSKTMMPEWTGEWMVEVLSEEGTPLESIIFFLQ